ncbi:response regulator transcription factor [Treponema sp.]|uniref:response regulator transcription factor n=1 Tax=Treponema sp. TaxID=166 RepID=UPI003F0AAA55
MKIKSRSLFLSAVLLLFFYPAAAKEKISKNEIPVNIKYYVDSTGEKTLADIDDSLFENVYGTGNSGSYKGALWLDIRPEVSEIHHCIVSFGKDRIDSAEFYEKRDGQYHFLGKIGYSCTNGTESKMDVFHSFPVFGDSLCSSDCNIRIRIMNRSGNFITVKLFRDLVFFHLCRIYFIKLYTVLGVSFCIFVILFIYALSMRRLMVFFLSVSSLFYFLFQIQARGGGLFFLREFSVPFFIFNRLEYCFETSVFLFLFFSACCALKKCSGSAYRKISPIAIQLVVVSYALLFTVQEESMMLYSYTILSIVSKIFFVLSVAFCLGAVEKNTRIIMLLWIPQTLFFSMMQISRAFRIKSSNAFFDFLAEDSLMLSFCFFLISTMPVLFFIAQKICLEIQESKSELEKIRAQNSQLAVQNNLMNGLFKGIMFDSMQILSMVDILSRQIFAPRAVSYIEIVKINSAKISDIIAGFTTYNDRSCLEEHPILLTEFFLSCIQASKICFSSREVALSHSVLVNPGTLILADMRIAELFFISFLNSVIEVSVPGSGVAVCLKDADENFVLSVSAEIDAKNEQEVLRCIESKNDRRNFTFIMQMAEIYRGSLSVSGGDGKFKFSVALDFCRVENSADRSVIINKTRFSSYKKNAQTRTERGKAEDTALVDASAEKTDDPAKKLSSRERQISELIISGKSDKEIADELCISPGTVASHNKKIFKKLDVHSRVELINKLR